MGGGAWSGMWRAAPTGDGGRTCRGVGAGRSSRRIGWMTSYLQKRPSSNGAAAGPAAPAVSLEDAAKVPALMEFLTADRWPDGSPRRPGTCLLLADDGRLKVGLSDPDQGLVAFLVLPSLLC